jgi:argininosuccinate lyase
LVRDHRLPFRTAHAVSARLIAASARRPDQALASLLAEVSAELLGSPLAYTDAELTTILSPRHFVAVRKTLGGPAPEETARAARASRAQFEADEAWVKNSRDALAAAERQLADRSARL